MTTFLMIFAAVASAITSVQTALTRLFRRRGRFFVPGPLGRATFQPAGSSSREPFVSILKPLCGLDDELEQNLASFVALRGIAYEVICSVADPADPAIAAFERVRRAHPFAPFRLIVGGDARLERANRKVARLIAAAQIARGDVLLVSDSNVRVEADDVARTLQAFRDPRVGCVSNLFVGAGAQTFGATIESLHLLSFVVTGAVIAAFAGVPCVVGKSMALTRRALEAIGGFEAFANVLAEDQAIGLAVRGAGFRVTLSPVVVRNIVVRRTVKRALDRQIRWNKIRYAFSRRMYAAELLCFPLPFAIISMHFNAALMIAVMRMAQVALLSRAAGAGLGWRAIYAPVLDLLQFGAQFVPYFDDTVTWRGHTARIGPNTVMLEAAEAA